MTSTMQDTRDVRAKVAAKGHVVPAPPSRFRQRGPDWPLCVLRTDNGPRVRDGYISESARGHARQLPTRAEQPICRTNVHENARACTPLPPPNFHGKEGVDGSSPSEGSFSYINRPQMGGFVLSGRHRRAPPSQGGGQSNRTHTERGRTRLNKRPRKLRQAARRTGCSLGDRSWGRFRLFKSSDRSRKTRADGRAGGDEVSRAPERVEPGYVHERRPQARLDVGGVGGVGRTSSGVSCRRRA